MSGGGQDININITSVARKYFKHQRSSQCQISQMTQAVWHLQNVWTKMHTLIRKYFWYLSNVLFAKNKVHTGFWSFCQLWKLPSVEIKTWTPLLQWNIQTRSWFIYLCNHITYCLDIFLFTVHQARILKSRLHQVVDVTFCKLGLLKSQHMQNIFDREHPSKNATENNQRS